MQALAMSYDGEPLMLTVTGIGDAVYYLKNSSSRNASGTSRNDGVGFPKFAVFEPDPAVHDRIARAYENGDAVKLKAAWATATPLSVNRIEFAA